MNLLVEQLITVERNVFHGINDDVLRDTMEEIANFKRVVIVDDDGNAKKAETGEELLAAIEGGKITVQEFGKVISSILRNDGMDPGMIEKAVEHLLNTSTFKRKYRDGAPSVEDLRTDGYTEEVIALIRKETGLGDDEEVDTEQEPAAPTPIDPPTLVDKIKTSIQRKHVVTMYYDGDEPGGKGAREIEPVAFGRSKANNLVVRAWDFKGASHRGFLGTRPFPGWRLFRVDKILTYNLTSDIFDEERPDYNRNGDKSMTELILNAKFDD